MIKISIRDIVADLPPSVLKKRIQEIDKKNLKKEFKGFEFDSLDKVWHWLCHETGITASLHKNEERRSYFMGSDFMAEFIESNKRTERMISDISYEDSNNRIVIDVQKPDNSIYVFIIEEEFLPHYRFSEVGFKITVLIDYNSGKSK